MKHLLSLFFFLSCISGFSQTSGIKWTGTKVEKTSPATDSVLTTKNITHGEKDSAVFNDSLHVPFKMLENRGEKAPSYWIYGGAVKATNYYLGFGFFQYSTKGMNELHIGYSPVKFFGHPTIYMAAERTFFLLKKEKEKYAGLTVEYGHADYVRIRYCVKQPIIKTKFYGVNAGVQYESMLNLRNSAAFYTIGEEAVYNVDKNNRLMFKAGVSRVAFKHLEYTTKYRSKPTQVTSMHRFTVDGLFIPVQQFSTTLVSGTGSAALPDNPLLFQKKFGVMAMLDGKTSFHAGREFGLTYFIGVIAPFKNPYTEHNFMITAGFGFYFSPNSKI